MPPGTWARRATAPTASASPSSPATRAASTPCRRSCACGSARAAAGRCTAPNGTTRCMAPLLWEEDGQALLFTAEQQGRQHLWRFDLPDRRAEVVVRGGTVSAFDKRAGTLVTLADSAAHPARVHAHLPGEAPRRIESFNDRVLAGVRLGRTEELWFEGALGRPGADVADLPARLRREEALPAAARHPRRAACRRRRRLALPLEHGGLRGAGLRGVQRQLPRLLGLRLCVPGQHHAALRPAGAAGHRSRHRRAAEAALGRREARVRRRRQLRRLPGGVDERPRRARALPGLRLPCRLLRLDGDVRRRLLPLARARVRRLVLGRPGQGQCAERAERRRRTCARPRWWCTARSTTACPTSRGWPTTTR